MRLARLGLGLLFLVGAIRPAFAQDEVATVRLDGQAVFQVGPTTDGDDPTVRARRIETRLSGSSAVREGILTAFKAARIPLPDPDVRVITTHARPS